MRYNIQTQLNGVFIMPKLVWLSFLLVFVFSTPLHAKDKDSSLEKAIKDIASDDDHQGKGKGRPDNPGEHGRDNAADKQSRGHGNGSKKEDSWEDKIGDELKGDDKDKNKKSKKKKK